MRGKKVGFDLDSGQCELLLAFENAASLSELSRMISRDVSVVSRQLQRLAETAPVIEKSSGRWRLTELGKQMNRWSKGAMMEQERILQQQGALRFSSRELPGWIDDSALILVGVQEGFDDPIWGRRNNPKAEENISTLLRQWRKSGRFIAHAKHESLSPLSPLRADTSGSRFKSIATPSEGELVIKKSVNSAFGGGELEKTLTQKGVSTLVVAGFSTNHCVDATARAASDLGFRVYVVSDATVSFERIGPDGKFFSAEEIHSVVMANLHQEFALVARTGDLLAVPHHIDEN